MSAQQPPRQPTEEELRAAYEAELERVTVDEVVLQTVVSLVNLGAFKLEPPEGRAPDLDQARAAIDAVRALMPLLEPRHGERLGPIRDGLARLQMAYARRSGGGPEGGGEPPREGGEPAPEAPPKTEAPGAGPAQRSGRLWVPGQ